VKNFKEEIVELKNLTNRLNAELNYYHSKYPSEKRPQQPKDSLDVKAVNIKK